MASMPQRSSLFAPWPLTVLALLLFACTVGQRDEIIAGIAVPIPRGMERVIEERVELLLPGLGAGRVGYRGNVAPQEVVAFYQKEMPGRGWSPNASLVTQGGFLVYSKGNQDLFIIVTHGGSGETLLGVAVGHMEPARKP
jgi:hypothetical protein